LTETCAFFFLVRTEVPFLSEMTVYSLFFGGTILVPFSFREWIRERGPFFLSRTKRFFLKATPLCFFLPADSVRSPLWQKTSGFWLQTGTPVEQSKHPISPSSFFAQFPRLRFNTLGITKRPGFLLRRFRDARRGKKGRSPPLPFLGSGAQVPNPPPSHLSHTFPRKNSMPAFA